MNLLLDILSFELEKPEVENRYIYLYYFFYFLSFIIT